ncbi:MAG: serine/threonine-protein kinase [Planctomycetota bacterium]
MEDLRTDPLLAKTTEVKGFKVLPPCVLYARIGAGGMGAVYRGHHLNLDIEVAVKCLKPGLVVDDPTFVDRFKREGRSAARINHQNVIRVFDVAENLGLHYLILEYVQGETARQRVERKGPLAVPEALQIVYEASLGLGEAHRMGIIHRDIKPDNLLISVRGQVKVADLGLAKPSIGGGQSVVSMAGQVMGTPPYMPPEQWGEGTVTNASDVWAMGAVLYYLLTAREAIQGDSLANIMSRIVLQDFPDVRELRPDVPHSVAALMAKATAKDAGQRFFDATELAHAVAELPEHRISLIDTDAGTTELRTMLSPPPMPQLDEIKQLLREGKVTTRNQAGPNGPATDRTGTDGTGGNGTDEQTAERTGARFRWAIVLLVLVLGGGGATAWINRDALFGTSRPSDPVPNPARPSVDPLAQARELQQQQRFVAALVAARTAFDDGDVAEDQVLLSQLREGSRAQLATALQQLAPKAPVPRDQPVRFEGRYDGPKIDALLLDDEPVELVAGSFAATRTPPPNGAIELAARITPTDTVPIATWQVTFAPAGRDEPAAAPVQFVGAVTTDPALGPRNTIGRFPITLVGRASEPDLELLLGDQVLTAVQWQPDGAFTTGILLAREGRNDLQLTVRRPGEFDGATTSLEVVRLIEPPNARIVSPAAASMSTNRTRIDIEVEADEWTDQVVAVLREQRTALQRIDGGERWQTPAPIELDDGNNALVVEVRNLTGKVRSLPLDVTCTAPTPKITGVAIEVGGERRTVQPGERVCVKQRPGLEVAIDDPTAKLEVDGNARERRFLLSSGQPGKARSLQLVAVQGKRRSKPFGLTIVVDTEKPTLRADAVPPAAAGTEVVVRGTWSDNVGVRSIGAIGGDAPKAKVTRDTPRSGSFELRLTVGGQSRKVPLLIEDEAGNTTQTLVTIATATASPVVVEPDRPTLARTIDAGQFEAIGALNRAGYPKALRHKATRIELLAVDLPDDGAPTLYVGREVVSDVQWNGDGDGSNQGSLTWLDVNSRLREARFAGLRLPTKQEWQRIRSANVSGIKIGGAREWLAQSPDESVDMRPLWDGRQVTAAKLRFSDSYTGFRVVFAPTR